MKNKFRVLITDAYHKSQNIEKSILKEIGAKVETAHCKTEKEVIALSSEMDALMVSYVSISRRVIEHLKKCKVIVKYAVGINNIDLDAASEKGIYIANVPNYCIEEVSTHTIALLLNLIRKISIYDKSTKEGNWNPLIANPLFRIKNKTLGIIGFGNIGKRVAEKIQAFGLSLLIHDPMISEKTISAYNAKKVDLNTLLIQSDFISLHCPLNKSTKYLIDFKEIEMMKKNVILINTSRGEIVNQQALFAAIRKGKMSGAALDVLEKDPPDLSKIIKVDNIIYTPHVAWNSIESEADLRKTAAQEVKRVLEGGKPLNLVNSEVEKMNRFIKIKSN